MKTTTPNTDIVTTTKGIGWKNGILIIISFLLILGFLYVVTTLPANAANTTPINSLFIDVNNDGLLDYIVSAKVIINTGNLIVSP